MEEIPTGITTAPITWRNSDGEEVNTLLLAGLPGMKVMDAANTRVQPSSGWWILMGDPVSLKGGVLLSPCGFLRIPSSRKHELAVVWLGELVRSGHACCVVRRRSRRAKTAGCDLLGAVYLQRMASLFNSASTSHRTMTRRGRTVGCVRAVCRSAVPGWPRRASPSPARADLHIALRKGRVGRKEGGQKATT